MERFGYSSPAGVAKDMLKGYTGVGGTMKRIAVSINGVPPWRLLLIPEDAETWDCLIAVTDGGYVEKVELTQNGIAAVVDSPTFLRDGNQVTVYCG